MNPAVAEVSRELAESLDAPERPDPGLAAKLAALTVGIHPNVPEDVYHARLPGMVNKTAADIVKDKSPSHYHAWLAGLDRKTTPALHFGKALHMALLEPERFRRTYVVMPDFGDLRQTERTSKERAKENKTRREAWKREHEGAVILDAADGVATLGMINRLCEHRTIRPLLEEGLPELTLVWQDEETGLRCKGRLDWYGAHLSIVADLKSTLSASARAFERSVWDYGYHRQVAFYRDGLATLGETPEDFVFIVGEKTPPYEVALFRIDPEIVEVGYQDTRDAIRRLAECYATGRFPGYPDEIQTITMAPWRKK